MENNWHPGDYPFGPMYHNFSDWFRNIGQHLIAHGILTHTGRWEKAHQHHLKMHRETNRAYRIILKHTTDQFIDRSPGGCASFIGHWTREELATQLKADIDRLVETQNRLAVIE